MRRFRSEATTRRYGLDQETTRAFGRQCLLARRLSERGVRFIQLYHTTGGFQPWDQHNDLKGGQAVGLHTALVPRPLEWGPGGDQPAAPDRSFDVVARDFIDLATQLGVD